VDGTSLIRFLRNLVHNPEELRRYKADPAMYLAQTTLSQEEQQLLRTITNPTPKAAIQFEVNTVFTLNISPEPEEGSQPGAADGPSIDLTGTQVELIAHSTPVIIEQTPPVPPYLICRLLPHSYVYLGPENKVSFHLHMCYVNPKDPTDQPFVVEIVTRERIPGQIFHFADAKVKLQAQAAMILTYDTWVERALCSNSSYNLATQELTLVFDSPPNGEATT
jgi:hypothetical protein